MAYEVRWTENAKEDFERILTFLEKEWSLKIAENFVSKFFSKLDVISEYPFVGSESVKVKKVRKILVTKHNVLYYMIQRNEIILLDFFDTRQDIDKDKFG